MDTGLRQELEEEVLAGERLAQADGEALCASDDPMRLGELAQHVRTQSRAHLLETIRDAGCTPAERSTRYDIVKENDGPVPLSQRRAEPQLMRAWA